MNAESCKGNVPMVPIGHDDVFASLLERLRAAGFWSTILEYLFGDLFLKATTMK